ncbi:MULTISPECIES: hypothetical protein [unclassified Halomonas]|uniref:hypothetical protein n=1 Tax=unclassified Halomonas TaxID=2609666 RepID=UPI0009904898|nr:MULTISPECIES: hypothetical protein [unclassified Halomonas]AQU84921.1 hypothetical protein B2G49_21435 [Halomonas sp. 'Soap Lake \
MKLKDFLNEHSQWISNNVPGEPPYSDIKVEQKSVSPDEFETIDVGEDPRITINGKLVTYSNE